MSGFERILGEFVIDKRALAVKLMRLVPHGSADTAIGVKAVAKSFMAKKQDIKRKWVEIDATDKILGRLATKVAMILMGKHRPTYTPHVDTGDAVIIVNASKIRVTGSKAEQKTYFKHTPGYLGHWRNIPYEEMLEKHPDRIIRLAVRRMLPKSVLGRAMLRKLKIIAGPEHNHQAQEAEKLEI